MERRNKLISWNAKCFCLRAQIAYALNHSLKRHVMKFIAMNTRIIDIIAFIQNLHY